MVCPVNVTLVLPIYKNTGPGARIVLSVQPRGDTAWRIVFGGFHASGVDTFPDAETRSLAASIGVTILFDRAADQLEIEVPQNYQLI